MKSLYMSLNVFCSICSSIRYFSVLNRFYYVCLIANKWCVCINILHIFRNQNHLMTAVMSHLSPYHSRPLVQDLIASLLSACPDQIHHFLKGLAPFLAPRETTKWVANISFLCKVRQQNFVFLIKLILSTV